MKKGTVAFPYCNLSIERGEMNNFTAVQEHTS